MTSLEILARYEAITQNIAKLKKELLSLREECKHESTYLTHNMDRFCRFCGKGW